ncbi:MAG: DUF4870 domain-containing protein [Microthrixaceae bacterium]|nr:DUF4870 domain-containing protein [Microthrixaceae bacterium]
MRWWDGVRWTEHVGGQTQQGGGQWNPGAPGAAGPAPVAKIDWSGHPWSNDPAGDRTMALIAHLLAMLAGIIGVGIFYAVSKERSQFVRHHATEALNFSITLTIASFVLPFGMMALFVGGLAVFGEGAAFGGFLIMFPIMIVLWLVAVVLPIMAMLAANRGEWYRYPVIVRFVSGPELPEG